MGHADRSRPRGRAAGPADDPRGGARSRSSTAPVLRRAVMDVAAAVARRRTGQDLVVCGPDADANRRLCYQVESSPVGPCTRPQAPHRAGPMAAASPPPAKSLAGRPHVLRDGQAKTQEAAMKHFTRELIERYGSPDDAVARAADASGKPCWAIRVGPASHRGRAAGAYPGVHQTAAAAPWCKASPARTTSSSWCCTGPSLLEMSSF